MTYVTDRLQIKNKREKSAEAVKNMSENVPNAPKISGLPQGVKLKQSDIDFMKIIEARNLDRVKKLQQTRRNNLLTGKLR